jgi:septal ring factor EnvC (AmiA/AmiB activator)
MEINYLKEKLTDQEKIQNEIDIERKQIEEICLKLEDSETNLKKVREEKSQIERNFANEKYNISKELDELKINNDNLLKNLEEKDVICNNITKEKKLRVEYLENQLYKNEIQLNTLENLKSENEIYMEP